MARKANKFQIVMAIACMAAAALMTLIWIQNSTKSVGLPLYHSQTREFEFSPEGIEFSRLTFVPDRRPPAALRKPARVSSHGELIDDEHELIAHYQADRIFLIPYWVPIGILLLFPSCVLARHVYRGKLESFRKRSGLCIACGYNIALTPTRCPECGTVPAT